MTDVIVIGGGLFGQIIAKSLMNDGRSVTVIDDAQPQAGSGPAACLMKPSWFSGLGKQVYTPALEELDHLYGVSDIVFTAGKVLHATVHWIRPSLILGYSERTPRITHINGTVRSVSPERRITYQDKQRLTMHELTADLVVCAGGVWTERLFPQYKQTAQKGVAFLQPNATIATPSITPWAPYRQLVAFNRGDGLWVSDGTAIKAENWTPDRELASWKRCQAYLPDDDAAAGGTVQALLGLRPYAKGHKPCLLEQPNPGIWVASGGAKNGTLAAGFCAHEIRRLTS